MPKRKPKIAVPRKPPKPPPSARHITVALSDLNKICYVCGEVKPDVRAREYRGKGYTGPCGDSFCFASCEGHPCRPVRTRACADCEKAGGVPATV